MSHDELCRSCGHRLGIGRFCVNCGLPKPGEATPTAPSPPPPVHGAPVAARYPLFADEPADQRDTLAAQHAPPYPPPVSAAVGRRRSSGPSWPSWAGWVAGLAAALAVVVGLGVGGLALLGSDDTAVDDPVAVAPDRADPPTEPAEPTEPTQPTDPAEPVDVARFAVATPPATAAPSRDVRGNAVRYEAPNMLDGEPDTAWRMPGDASGREVVFRLDAPTVISAVGLVNGYAKVERGYDGYAANRRITAVEWVFDDGTVVAQSLAEEPTLQGVEVADVRTETITLRIVAATPPAPGPAGRDYTAISDVAFAGTPA